MSDAKMTQADLLEAPPMPDPWERGDGNSQDKYTETQVRAINAIWAERVRVALGYLQALLTYTKSCEGMLNVIPAGQVTNAEKLLLGSGVEPLYAQPAASTVELSDERAAFEEFAKSNGVQLTKDVDGEDYHYPQAKASWAAFKFARDLLAKQAAQSPVASHPDDVAVDRFASAMKSKMTASRDKGRSGWDDPERCSIEDLAVMLVQHVEKGDPTDIGNFCMMIWNRVRDTGPDIYSAIADAFDERVIKSPVVGRDAVQWQSIETAPKDGTRIQIKFKSGNTHEANWRATYGGEWHVDSFEFLPWADQQDITHWRPLSVEAIDVAINSKEG